jgi:hypothetical protein
MNYCNIRSISSSFLILILSVSSIAVVNAQSSTKYLPYALGFYHGDLSLDPSLCLNEFTQVRDVVYPTYEYEIKSDSNITNEILDKIKNSRGGIGRKLLRSSWSSSSSKGKNVDNDKGNNHDQHARQLQTYCYTYCSTKTKAWLIAYGCGTECGVRRRLDDGVSSAESNNGAEMIEVPEMKDADVDSESHRSLQSIYSTYSTLMGKKGAILSLLGDTTAANFYATAQALIPESNPCQQIVLNMTYRVYPMIITV